MEEYLKRFRKSMGSFCSHLQSSCDALKQSVDGRPLPLDSASSAFIQSRNRQVSSVTSQLNLLEAMSSETVSFEELLGHCSQMYKRIQNDLLVLQDPLKSFGYTPDVEVDEHGYEIPGLTTPRCKASSGVDERLDPPFLYTQSIIKSLEEDPAHDESLSLTHMGLSDVCLATLSSQAHDSVKVTNLYLEEPNPDNLYSKVGQPDDETMVIEGYIRALVAGVKHVELDEDKNLAPRISVSTNDYANLPSYVKSLASFEDLLGATEKINSRLKEKKSVQGSYFFLQDEVHSLGLGTKGRAYFLLLMRMNYLAVETVDGVISYRVLQRNINQH